MSEERKDSALTRLMAAMGRRNRIDTIKEVRKLRESEWLVWRDPRSSYPDMAPWAPGEAAVVKADDPESAAEKYVKKHRDHDEEEIAILVASRTGEVLAFTVEIDVRVDITVYDEEDGNVDLDMKEMDDGNETNPT